MDIMSPGRSIADLFTAQVAAGPNRPLLLDADTGEERTYGATFEVARRWAAYFAAEGIGAGDRVAVVLPNGPIFAELWLGAALAGVTLAPYHAGLTTPEIAALASAHRVKLALVMASRAADLATTLDAPVIDVGARGTLPAALPAPMKALPVVDPRTPMVLIMTSGTSGGAKACVLPQANLVATAAAAAEAFGLNSRSRYLTPLPLHHINAQVIGLLAAVTAGGSVALGARLPPAKLWEAAARVRATGMSSVPALVLDLLGTGGAPPPSLKYVVCSSAALPDHARARFEGRFRVPLLFCYGLSEAGCFVSYSRVEPPSPPGSVGKPLGCEVRLGEGAEVLVRGPGVFAGYDADPEATAVALRGGWLHTGDVGRLDAEGFLFIEGRLKDMINRGGEKIAPDAIEAVLRECPGVAEVAVYAVADERLGEEVAAAVVVAPGADLDEDALFDFCADRLAEFETPKTWRFLAELPRGRTGKVLRRLLAE
jgi:long-chain acyl-CoA synthetase